MTIRLGLACALLMFPSGLVGAEVPDHIARAVDHPDRSAADRQRDETSRPARVLTFLGVERDMVVFDMLGGDGYYSEVLARAVGSSGRVYLHNNQGYRGLMNRLPRRLRGSGLDALEVYVREIPDINLKSESVDLVLLVKVYHDLYYLNNGWNVPPDPFFDTIWRILKPGGTLAVIDHRAPRGTGRSFAQNLHRIDPTFARADIEARGFAFDASSSLLANPEDDLQQSPFSEPLRGKTDRFLHRYHKTALDQASTP